MSFEIPQKLLDELTSEIPDLGSIIPEKRHPSLYRKAEAMIQIYGDGEKGELKQTGVLIANLDDKKVTLQLLEEPRGYILKVRTISHNTGIKNKLNISISEAETLWGENTASHDQLTTALKLITHLQVSGLSPALSPGEKWSIQQERRLSARHLFYEWDSRRFGP